MRFVTRSWRALAALGLSLMLLGVCVAYAHAEGAGMSVVNVQPGVHALLSLLPDIAAPIALAIAAWLAKHVKNDIARRALMDAITHGAGGVYEALVASGQSVGNVPVKNAAIAHAAEFVEEKFAPTMAEFGLSFSDIHELIRRGLGNMLAVDPNASISGPTAPSVPAVPVPVAAPPAPAPAGIMQQLGATTGILGIFAAALVLSACSPQQRTQITADLQTPPGQLFCALQTMGGGSAVVAAIDAAASGIPGVGPVAIIVTNASKAFVDNACAAAAVATGAISGIPVSPPANPVPQVAIVKPSA